MVYNIDKKLYRTFKIFEKNQLAPRAYAVPYSNIGVLEKTPLHDERYSSDIVRVLSGDWDFKFYNSVNKIPDKLNTSKIKFGTIPVPGDWQRNGIQEPVYLNCPYEFKTMVPDIPEDMPVGVYRKTFSIDKPAENSIISFLGVANNLSLYVNSQFAGYSEGSHNTAEFSIGSLLVPGENEIVVVSYKWCNGSFLESQDMFRENGIFRDVLLYQYDGAFVYDYEFTYEKVNAAYKPTVKVWVKGETKGQKLSVVLKDAAGNVLAEKTAAAKEENEIALKQVKVREWNAEIPTVYYLYISLSDGEKSLSIRQVAGFRRIEIDGSVFRFNDAPIKCKGVNHHDTNLYKGYAMSLEDMETDVKLMKELNVNAVRTSHYPPDPYFITLADVYGLYIIDEADIETHGCDELAGDTSIISHNRKWASYYVDRVRRMYFRDRNHPSILMWSLGNESGGYYCHDRCYDFLKSTGTPVPVHYEGVRWKKRFHYDVISEMYTSTEEMELMMKGKRHRNWDKGTSKSPCKEFSLFPHFLCEYCHAMGVGPGNLEEYWDIIYEWDTSMGGCIWEWADHTVYHSDGDKKYKYRYTYGGDHGEKQHDGHFCVDGLMYADRRPHTGAKEMKVVYRPVRASWAGGKLFCFENTNRFRDSSYIKTEWIMLENGVQKAKGQVDIKLAPMQSECIELDIPGFDPDRDCHINFIYTDKQTGVHIATEQLTLNDVGYEYDIEIGSKISVSTDNGVVTVGFEKGSVVFDGRTGDMTSYKVDGKELLALRKGGESGFAPNLFRALIDNDARRRDSWKKAGLDSLKRSLNSFVVNVDDGEADIYASYELKNGKETLYNYRINYIISSLGAIETEAHLICDPGNENSVYDIPRFGLTVELNRAFENIEYYGRGEAENMPDFKCQAPVGIYRTTVAEADEPYVYPQESGMHCDTKWIRLTDKKGRGLTIYADDTLAFSAHPYTQDALYKAQHREDLEDMGITFLTLDGALRGIGTSSCGPDTREEYRLDARKGYSFSFTVIPDRK